MSEAPSFERRHAPRRLEDVRPPVPPEMRDVAFRTPEARLRQARRVAAVGSLALILLAGVGCLILFDLALDMEVGGGTYLLFAIAAVLLWTALLPVLDRISRMVALAPRRGRGWMVRAIRRGLDQDEFELVFQPQIDLETGLPIGVEALLRWRRGDEVLPPAEFLSDAERGGVMDALTERVLELSLAQAGRWARAGRSLRISINLSAANLRNFAVVERLGELIDENEIPPGMIVLEVTETAVLEEPEQTRAVLDALAELGVSISVDDFGVGYSSLLWLRLFPVAEVKIDRSFVGCMDSEGDAFVSGVIRLGHDLGLRVVAEGVEEAVTLQRLQELRCDLAQGYLFAKPLDPEAVEGWLEDPSNHWAPKRKEISLASNSASLAEARQVIGETAAELGYDDAAIWELKLAATEALMNAIEHGTPSEDGMVHLRLAQEHGDMLLEVWGGGEAEVDPMSNGSNRGRGISIMTALMDEVELKRNSEDSRIRLAKRRSNGST